MIQKIISDEDRLKLCDELNTMTTEYANDIFGYDIYCKKCDVDKYLALGNKYGLICHSEQHNDIWIVSFDFYKIIK